MTTNIVHNWSDKYCLQILRNLRNAAAPDTRLPIVDNLLSYACDDDSLKDIPGADRPVPPKPLLPNMGYAAATSYYTDMQVRISPFCRRVCSRLMLTTDDGTSQWEGAHAEADERADGSN